MKSNTRRRRLIRAVFRCLLCTVAALLLASPSRATDRSIWQMLPYDVKIVVALDPAPPLTPQLREELLACLNERIEQTIGATWNMTAEPAPPALRGAMLRDIDAVTPEQLTVPYPPPDKILLLAVKCLPGGLEVNARDFDVRTNIISSPVSRPVSQIGMLGDAMLDAVLSCFAPLAYIDDVKKNYQRSLQKNNCDNTAQGVGPAAARSQFVFHSQRRRFLADQTHKRQGRETCARPIRSRGRSSRWTENRPAKPNARFIPAFFRRFTSAAAGGSRCLPCE